MLVYSNWEQKCVVKMVEKNIKQKQTRNHSVKIFIFFLK